MRAPRAPNPIAAWLAVLAILAAALAPAWGQVWGRLPPAQWATVCTAQGATQATEPGAGTGKAPLAPDGGHALEHCPYCSLHAPTLGLPPPPEQWAPPAAVCGVALFDVTAAPATSLAWLTAQPRAPPTWR